MDHNFKKYFGQNFLTSDEELIKFVSHINPKENDLIIEIGPGEGVLTHYLAKSNAKVICIEIDKDLVPTLKSTFEKYPNVEIQNSDFLQLDLKEILSENGVSDTKCLKIVGSLPYNISKKIIKKCLEEIVGIKYELVFLLQKEVAEDYAENPPRASFLSNYIKLFGKCNYCMTISKDFFYPVPKVDGGVIKVEVEALSKEEILNRSEIARFIKSGFLSPRKTLANNFKHVENIKEIIKSLGISELSRPQDIEISTWKQLWQTISDKN
jgi:16S rRNA (adenine1518-N6/adenine1519-N6)-dimethyltransferase